MAVPKKRTSRSRRRKRGIKPPVVFSGSHFISDEGTYNKRQVLINREKPKKDDQLEEVS